MSAADELRTARRVQTSARQIDRGPDHSLTQEDTYLVRTEHVIPDDAPDPAPPNRATRRAMQRKARRTK